MLDRQKFQVSLVKIVLRDINIEVFLPVKLVLAQVSVSIDLPVDILLKLIVCDRVELVPDFHLFSSFDFLDLQLLLDRILAGVAELNKWEFIFQIVFRGVISINVNVDLRINGKARILRLSRYRFEINHWYRRLKLDVLHPDDLGRW